MHGYSYLDSYWTEEGRWAFFLKVDGKLAGFAMVIGFPAAGGAADYNNGGVFYDVQITPVWPGQMGGFFAG